MAITDFDYCLISKSHLQQIKQFISRIYAGHDEQKSEYDWNFMINELNSIISCIDGIDNFTHHLLYDLDIGIKLDAQTPTTNGYVDYINNALANVYNLGITQGQTFINHYNCPIRVDRIESTLVNGILHIPFDDIYDGSGSLTHDWILNNVYSGVMCHNTKTGVIVRFSFILSESQTIGCTYDVINSSMSTTTATRDFDGIGLYLDNNEIIWEVDPYLVMSDGTYNVYIIRRNGV